MRLRWCRVLVVVAAVVLQVAASSPAAPDDAAEIRVTSSRMLSGAGTPDNNIKDLLEALLMVVTPMQVEQM